MDDVAVMPTRHKLHVDDYYRMVDAGILGKYDHVELIDGEIIDMAPVGQDHEAAVNGLTKALVLACGDRAIVSIQNSICFDLRSAPQPDAAVFRPRADRYRAGARPGPADTYLLVQVAKRSIEYDKTVKSPLYALAGIAEYWIVDLRNGVLDTYRRPEGGMYAEHKPHGPSDRIPLLMDPEIVVPLDIVFG